MRDSLAKELLELVRGLKDYLRWEERNGLLGLPLLPEAGPDLAAIRELIGDCRRCKLWSGRKHIVFGAGPEKAKLVLVGEGPGAEEDEMGEPFVGKAGQLLTKMLAAIGLKREHVYICNLIKCRPPQNRNPQPDEIEACKPYLMAQLRALSPRLICALGAFAAQNLLQTNAPISTLRGKFHRFQGIPLLATYHPAYLLRNPEEKRKAWEDLKMLKEEYERISGSS